MSSFSCVFHCYSQIYLTSGSFAVTIFFYVLFSILAIHTRKSSTVIVPPSHSICEAIKDPNYSYVYTGNGKSEVLKLNSQKKIML